MKPNIKKSEKYEMKALMAFQAGNYRHEIKYYKLAIKFNPGNGKILYNLGVCYQSIGDIENAFECYVRAIGTDPEYHYPYLNLANIHLDLGNYDAAILGFTDYLNLTDEHEEQAFNGLGSAHSNIGNSKEAEKYYKLAIKSKPDYANAWFNLGSLYAADGMTDQAFEHLEKTIQLDPEDGDAYFNLAKLYAGKEDFELMKEMLVKSAKYGNMTAQERCADAGWD